MRCGKRLLTAFFFSLFAGIVHAQQLSLGNAPYTMNKSAVLELNANNQGLLLPRIADTLLINALNPPDGMVIYFTPSKQFLLRAYGYWNPLAASSSFSNYWNTAGNTNGGIKKIGTADNYALPFVTNNTERMRLTTAGFLGIGTTNPSALLHVSGTNPLTLNGVQNGTTTSADSLLTINNGTVQKLPVSTFALPANTWLTTGNGGTNSGTNFIGTTTNASLRFKTNNTEKFVIDSNGNVGVAKAVPVEKLDVTGNIRFSGALMPGGSAGNTGYILTSSGAGIAPTWQDGSTYISSTAWLQGGNSFTSLKNFGTISNYSLPFITNNTERMRLTNTGYLGIGTSAPSTLLHVSGTNPLTLNGVQNGGTTTADSVLTINNGTVQKLPVSTFQAQINGTGFVKASGTALSYDNNAYTVANAAITSATKTKITYDAKGLVTAGADATTTDIAEGTNLYYTDARVRATPLAGLSTATPTTVTATDNLLAGVGKLQGQINAINTAGYLTGNQTVTLSGDVSGSGTTAITTAIGTNKITLNHMAQVANGTFLGRTTAGTGNVEALTTTQAKALLGITGSNSGDVSLAGQNYLSLSGQTITVNALDLSGTHATGTLAAARFGALTGDVTNTAGSYATTIANGAVTYGKMQNVSAANRLLGRATTGAGSAEEITIGSGLTLTGTTLSASGTGQWNTTGNSGTNHLLNFLGTTDNTSFRLRTNNVQRMIIDSMGYVGIGVTNPGNPLVVKDTFEIRRTGTLSTLLFSNTSGSGDFRIGGDGGDIFWQGGGGRALQMGSYWGMVLGGDRQSATLPSFLNGSGGTGVLIPSQRAGSIPLAIQGAASQTANLTEWRNSAGTVLGAFNNAGGLGIGTPTFDGSNPERLLINGGTTASYNLIKGKATINNYLQMNIQNLSNGNTASSDLVATADNGSETTNYVDLGINGSGYTGGFFGAANDGYLYSMGQDFLIGNATAGQALCFLTGGGDKATNTRMTINEDGNVGIGSAAFDATSPEKLLIDAGSDTYTAVLAKGNINDYLQINIKNSSSGNQGSSDLVATANNGTETTNFVDLGINGSGYVYQTGNPIETGKANDGYLISSGKDFYIVNNNASKDIIFLSGGTAPTNEAMRITSTETVGIATSSPNSSTKLDVAGAVKIGSNGTVVKNLITAIATFVSSQSVTAANFVSSSGSITPGTTDITYNLPAANTLASVQAAVSVSPGSDLPTGVSIAYARPTSTTSIKVRFINNSTSTQTIASGTKLYISITDF